MTVFPEVCSTECLKYEYSELIELSHWKLLEAKQICRDQGGNNAHREQAALTPNHIIIRNVYVSPHG